MRDGCTAAILLHGRIVREDVAWPFDGWTGEDNPGPVTSMSKATS